MSFSGDLEHLPIVDIIQLLHSTRKTGTLRLIGAKGESRLVFSDGYIICANHSNNSVRLGQVLLNMQAITQEALAAALAEQHADDKRQPLIAMLIEGGRIDKPLAYKGLETLIVMTIIDILTWDGGTFIVDVEDVSLSDEYLYLSKNLDLNHCTSTQNILMDALRIYDEKMRDGELNGAGIFPATEEEAALVDAPSADVPPTGMEISADLLGLDELDHIEKKIPDVFKGLHTRPPLPAIEAVDLGEVTEDERKTIAAALEEIVPATGQKPANTGQLIIFFSRDRLLKGAVGALCKRSGRSIFTIDDETSLDLLIEQALAKEIAPHLLLDAPESDTPGFDATALFALLTRRLQTYPEMVCTQLYTPDQAEFALRASAAGAQMILPRGSAADRGGRTGATIALLGALHAWFDRATLRGGESLDRLFGTTLQTLFTLTQPAEISALLLKFMAAVCTRGQTLIVAGDELVAERGFDRDRRVEGIGPFPLKARIPLAGIATFARTVESGRIFCGVPVDFAAIAEHATTPPRRQRILLLPITVAERTIAVIYGDYGLGPASTQGCEQLALLARSAGLILEKTRQGTKPAHCV